MSKTSSQLRNERLKIYEKYVIHKRVIPRINGRVLIPSPIAERKKYFSKFTSMYISGKRSPWEDDGFFQLKKNSQGYKAFSRFSETNYGSSVIREMVNNFNKYKTFQVRSSNKPGAFANYKKIILPGVFPNKLKKFKVSGQNIFDLGIIYHEFAHTMVFRKASSQNKMITIQDERMAVMKFENPVRIKKGFEPRYTYTRNGSTINIITGKKKMGKWVVSKYNPSILVGLNTADALK